jgi:hypothetical protein
MGWISPGVATSFYHFYISQVSPVILSLFRVVIRDTLDMIVGRIGEMAIGEGG